MAIVINKLKQILNDKDILVGDIIKKLRFGHMCSLYKIHLKATKYFIVFF